MPPHSRPETDEREVRIPLLRSRQDRGFAIALAILGGGGALLGPRMALPVSIVALVSGGGAFFVKRLVRMYRFDEDEPGVYHVTLDTGRYWWLAFALAVLLAILGGRTYL